MSYILDALRKAEAERERGHVPSIHAQQAMPGAMPPVARHGSTRWGLIGAVLLAIVLVMGAAFAWWRFSGSSTSSPAPSVALTTPSPASPPAAAVATTPPLPATSPAPVAESPAARKTKSSPAAGPGELPKPLAGTAAPSSALPARSATPAPAPVTANANANTNTNADSSGPLRGKIYALSELPDAIRSQLPALAIGGSMYSPVRANRLLIVNGQVAHEGDTVAPGVVLEQLRVKNAVMSFRGYQYMLPF
jgi:general secretion pathway protein B